MNSKRTEKKIASKNEAIIQKDQELLLEAKNQTISDLKNELKMKMKEIESEGKIIKSQKKDKAISSQTKSQTIISGQNSDHKSRPLLRVARPAASARRPPPTQTASSSIRRGIDARPMQPSASTERPHAQLTSESNLRGNTAPASPRSSETAAVRPVRTGVEGITEATPE